MNKLLTIILIPLFFIITDISSQWVELNTGVTANLNSLSSVKDVTTWACGNNGTVIKSSDMGDHWQNGNISGIPANYVLNHIYAQSQVIAFTCATNNNTAYLFRTINGGSSWETVLTQFNGKFNSLHFIDNNTGILTGDAVGGRWSVWKTVNGGLNWDSAGMRLPQNLTEKGFSNSLWASGVNIWMGTDNYRLYKSTNFGSTWVILSTGSEKNSYSMWFDFDFNIGFTGNQSLIKTSNSGNNWFNDVIPGTGLINGVTGSAHSRYNWAIRENKIYVNPHNENVWRYDYTSPAGNYTYITIERNGFFGGAVFAIRDNGGISRTTFITIGIENITTEIPKEFNLHQNYPNPFNPLTKIKFDIAENENVSLKIFDVNGKLVEVLTENYLNAGTYSAEWNAGNTGSGIYFCRLTTGNKTFTKKMALIK